MNGALWCFSVTAVNVFTSIWSVGKAANWVSVFPGHREVSLSINTERQQRLLQMLFPTRFQVGSDQLQVVDVIYCVWNHTPKVFLSSLSIIPKSAVYHSPRHWNNVLYCPYSCAWTLCTMLPAESLVGWWCERALQILRAQITLFSMCCYISVKVYEVQGLFICFVMEFKFPLLRKHSRQPYVPALNTAKSRKLRHIHRHVCYSCSVGCGQNGQTVREGVLELECLWWSLCVSKQPRSYGVLEYSPVLGVVVFFPSTGTEDCPSCTGNIKTSLFNLKRKKNHNYAYGDAWLIWKSQSRWLICLCI